MSRNRGIVDQGTTRKMTKFEIATRELVRINARIKKEQAYCAEVMAEALAEARAAHAAPIDPDEV